MTTQSIALPAPRVATAPWAALPVIVAGAFMVVLDFFIVNVALPSMASDLAASSSSLEWIVASYGLSVAAFLITAGRLGDNLGRRRMYAGGVALFTIASIGCGVAPTASVLIGARVLQGVAGALVMPQVLAIIGVSFHGADRVKATGIYSMALGLAAVGGQLIGGALVHADVAGLGWRACFFINVPIGVAALVAVPRVVPESRTAVPTKLDLVGVALVSGGDRRRDAPADRGPPARLAAVELASFASAGVAVRGVHPAPAHAHPPRRRAAARPHAVRVAGVLRRARHPAPVLVRAGGVLRLPRAVPPGGARPEPARRRARVHDRRGHLRRPVRCGAAADRASRAARAADRRRHAGGRASGDGDRGVPDRHRRLGRGAGSRDSR